MNTIKCIVLPLIISSGWNGQTVQAQPDQKAGNPNFDKIYPIALRGDLHEVFDILDTLDIETLSDKQQERRNAFYSRFITDTEQFDYNTNDSLIIRSVDRFHHYWKSVMLDKQRITIADSLFEVWAVSFLYDNHYRERAISRDSLAKNLYEFSNNFLRERGLYGTAFGKTVPLQVNQIEVDNLSKAVDLAKKEARTRGDDIIFLLFSNSKTSVGSYQYGIILEE